MESTKKSRKTMTKIEFTIVLKACHASFVFNKELGIIERNKKMSSLEGDFRKINLRKLR